MRLILAWKMQKKRLGYLKSSQQEKKKDQIDERKYSEK